NYALGGLDPTGYHVLNLALHVGCGLLLYEVARRTFRLTGALAGREDAAACFAALVVMVHPLQTECVTYVISRSELLMALCYLGVLELVRLAEAMPARRGVRCLLAVALAAFGMTAKALMVTVPLTVWWLARWVLAPPTRPRIAFAETPAEVEVPRRWP